MRFKILDAPISKYDSGPVTSLGLLPPPLLCGQSVASHAAFPCTVRAQLNPACRSSTAAWDVMSCMEMGAENGSVSGLGGGREVGRGVDHFLRCLLMSRRTLNG